MRKIKKIIFFSKMVVCFISSIYCLEPNSKILNENNYRKNSNWADVEKKYSEVFIEYKIQDFNGILTVTELYYYGKNKQGKNLLLGSFTVSKGFLNSKGQEFISGDDIKKNSKFFKQYFLGLSRNSIDKPFSLYGIAISSDNKIYETEILCRLCINCDENTLEEWFPKF